ncbi:MAG: rod shape-determining protein MreC [Desulfobacteraceae bacterium]|nr:MAG: rod shape-determining protein MreC [Desulfobacteraceae bacterium]
MFSRKTMMIVGVIILVAVNVIVLSVSGRHHYPPYTLERVALTITAPFQDALTHTIRFTKSIWRHYFLLVSTARENENLKKNLSDVMQRNREYIEVEISNDRLRKLFDFSQNIADEVIAAEVIGIDPSAWYRTIIIDKGRADGVKKGLPVIIPEGVVGQVINSSEHYSKVLLIIDQNSAVDALVQRNRARGIIKGISSDQCIFKYVLRRHDLETGDSVIASGLDGVFPKGLRIGYVAEKTDGNSGLFWEVRVTPFVDFEKLEEVLILLNPSIRVFTDDK